MKSIHLKSIDLNLLLVFDQVYRSGSLTKAGRELGRTQSAISHSLEKLRRLFDDPLFVRTSRQMTPTPRAVELAKSVQKALAELQNALSVSQSFDPETVTRSFSISMSDYVEAVLLPRLMAYLYRHSPGIQIEVVSPTLADTQSSFESGDLEMIIGNRDVSAGTFQQELWTDEFVCMISRNHPAIKESLNLDQYLSYPHVLFAASGKRDRIVDHTLTRQNLKRKTALRTPSVQVVPGIIQNTPYITTLPRMLAELVENSSVTILPSPIEFPKLKIMQYWHPIMHRDPAHQWLRKTIHGLSRSGGSLPLQNSVTRH